MKGYVITSTPGLIRDVCWPLSASGIERGDISRTAQPNVKLNDLAVFETEEAANAAMLTLVPPGKQPEGYAGLSVDKLEIWHLYGWKADEIIRRM